MAGTAAVAAGQASCKFQYRVASTGTTGATYDVSSLYDPQNDWVWQDSVNNQTATYTYTFNVCGNVNPSNAPAGCVSLAGTTPAPAYQSGPSYPCTPLAQSFPATSGLLTHWMDLIDPNEPAGGVKLVYNPPTTIPAGQCAPSFTLNFRCGYEPFPSANSVAGAITPVTDATVLEVNTCAYETFTWSLAGCPQECPIVNGALCNNAGICGYDTQVMKARCFCDDGYTSAGCSESTAKFPSGAVAGAVFGGLITGAGALLGYAFYASRKAASTSTVDGFYA